MRFRLSSLLLLIALVAVVFAWYVDHHRHRSDDIVGVWYYPTPDQPCGGCWETLTIHADGTFTLEDRGRIGGETYCGTYTPVGNGVALFHVISKQTDCGQIAAKIETFGVNKTYRCRIARDSHSSLIVVDLDPNVVDLDPDMGEIGKVKVVFPEDVDITWRCYTSMSHHAQSEAMRQWIGGIVHEEKEAAKSRQEQLR